MSEIWISAREAREAVSPGCNFVGQATDAICRYAAAGLVRARAAMFTVEAEGRKEQVEDHLIVADFWSLKLEKQDWMHGVFLGVDRSMSWEIRCEALGVTFDRAGIEAMAPTVMQAKALPVDLPSMADESQLGEPHAKAVGGGKLPRLPDAPLIRWRNALSDEERDLPRVELHKRCVAAHPDNSISRERVRALLPRLKPGPRPIKRNSSA